MPRPDVVCLGILVADVVVRSVDSLPLTGTLGLVDSIDLRGGGCALNTASVLSRLGLRAAVIGKVGSDALGSFLIDQMSQRGVSAAAVVRDPVVPTSASVALVNTAGERTFLHSVGANATLHADEFSEAAFAGRALHIGGALALEALDREWTAALLAEARQRGLHTSLDTVYDASGRWSRVVSALPYCDLATPGLAEALAITGESDPPRAARRLCELGVRVAAVTVGSDGCYLCSDEVCCHVPGFDVVVRDGTGAGDAFAAGFLYGSLAGWPAVHCAQFANAAGALATTAIGAYAATATITETLRLAGLL